MKKHFKYILTFTTCICLIFNSVVPVFAVETETETEQPIVELGWTWDNFYNFIKSQIGYIATGDSSQLRDRLKAQCAIEGVNFDDYCVYPKTDADGNTVISSDIQRIVKDYIDELNKSKIVTISPVTTNADPALYDTYGADLSVFKSAGSAAAYLKFIREKGGSYYFGGNQGYNWFTFRLLDHSSFAFAYLGSNYKVITVDKDLNPVNAYMTRSNRDNPLPQDIFTYDDLVAASANYTTFSGLSSSDYPIIFNPDNVSNRTKYYGKPFRCFTSVDYLIQYIYGNSDCYFTSAYMEDIHDISVNVNDISKFNQEAYNNIYNLISKKLKEGVDAGQLQEIIDNLVNEELKKLGVKLDDIGDSVDQTNTKLDTIINELKEILDKLGLLYEVDENGNVVIKNFNFDIDLNANVVVPIIGKLVELNNNLTAKFDNLAEINVNQTQAIEDVSSTLMHIRSTLEEMLNNQQADSRMISTLFVQLFEKIDNLQLTVTVDMSGTNALLEDIKKQNSDNHTLLDTVSGYLKDIYNKLNDLDKLGLNDKYFKDILEYSKSIDKKLGVLIGIESSQLLLDILDELADEDGNIDYSHMLSSLDFSEVLQKKFPFSLPWDIYYMFLSLASTPVVPTFDIRFFIQSIGFDYTAKIDLSDFQVLSRLSRSILSLTFGVYLIKLSKDLINKL